MRIFGVVASSNPPTYQLAQTYTSTSTYTVPAGIVQIAVLGVAQGGNGANGTTASTNGGAGGGGGGGGAAIGIWNWNVTAGQTFTCTFNTSGIFFSDGAGNSFGGYAGSDGFFGQRGNGGTTVATGHGFLPNRTFANGGNGGNGGATKNTDGPGNNGDPRVAGTQLYNAFWPSLGLPVDIYSGGGGGGGGSGARDSSGFQFYSGGGGGAGGGGIGGDAFQDGFLNGYPGSVSLSNGAGGGGGGGGAYQLTFGNGVGGNGASGNAGIIYIYER